MSGPLRCETSRWCSSTRESFQPTAARAFGTSPSGPRWANLLPVVVSELLTQAVLWPGDFHCVEVLRATTRTYALPGIYTRLPPVTVSLPSCRRVVTFGRERVSCQRLSAAQTSAAPASLARSAGARCDGPRR